VRPARDQDDPAGAARRGRRQLDEQEVRQVVDAEGQLEAVAGGVAIVRHLDARIRDERPQRRPDAAVQARREGPHVVEGGEVEASTSPPPISPRPAPRSRSRHAGRRASLGQEGACGLEAQAGVRAGDDGGGGHDGGHMTQCVI
jgi:hypothetical protein